MEWTELKITVEAKDADAAAAIAHMAVPYGIYVEDYSDLEQQVEEIAHIDLIDENLQKQPRDQAVIHIYLEPETNPAESIHFLEHLLEPSGMKWSLDRSAVEQEDWENEWKNYYYPFAVGERLVVCPQWEQCRVKPGQTKLVLNPGMAFGTGMHETTRLCLTMLEQNVRPGMDVLDVGCGSGILSIAALLLGAETALGVDIDPIAVKTAEENAKLNEIYSPQCRFVCGDLVDHVDGKYHIILANIVADVVIKICRTVPTLLHSDGLFLCSGILEMREQEVIDALRAAGLTPVRIERERGWVAIGCVLDS